MEKRSKLITNPSVLTSDLEVHDSHQHPASPASSTTSQTTGDTSFEPSIDMLVNDFDDERTLTEEEALAEKEEQFPADEIETLQKENEIPLEELLAHYGNHMSENFQQKRQKKIKALKRSRQQSEAETNCAELVVPSIVSSPAITSAILTSSSKLHPIVSSVISSTDEIIVIDESDEEVDILKAEKSTYTKDVTRSTQKTIGKNEKDEDDELYANKIEGRFKENVDYIKRSHLLELYPEKFANINNSEDGEDLSEEDDDNDSNYIQKTIMVGFAYQAIIPGSLSKYGDVLPYENEDKLIWDPSQVTEQEVEEFLVRVKEIKSSLALHAEDYLPSSLASQHSDAHQCSNLTKDDEQALHLLVQCGYNFKEALRRKRLNAVPLTGTMSLWSEEECRNFEDGIQKYGKNFRKIRENQVRTRSIRELVQFYYLWKKTSRRDEDFIDSDTVDYMDIYLDDDDRNTGTNGASKAISTSQPSCNCPFSTKKHQHNASALVYNNFSIMKETKSKKDVKNKSKVTECNKNKLCRSNLLLSNKSLNTSCFSPDSEDQNALFNKKN